MKVKDEYEINWGIVYLIDYVNAEFSLLMNRLQRVGKLPKIHRYYNGDQSLFFLGPNERGDMDYWLNDPTGIEIKDGYIVGSFWQDMSIHYHKLMFGQD